jgi:hypothetical protein
VTAPPKFRSEAEAHAWDGFFAAALGTRLATRVLRTTVPAGEWFFRDVESRREVGDSVAIAATVADAGLKARRCRERKLRKFARRTAKGEG